MVNANRSLSSATRCPNRIAAIMAHITRYSFRGNSRLAHDAGLSRSTITHLVRGLNNPLYITVRQVVKSLEFQLGRRLAFDQVIAVQGRYPTPSVCELCRFTCGRLGCLPDSVCEEDGSRKRGLEDAIPGHWTGDWDEFSSDAKGPEDPGTE